MDSKLAGLPLSAAPQGRTPTMASLSTSTGSNSSSFLIRAPPTVDSDVESSNGQENLNYTSSGYGSDSGFESEGFLSGEDGFETASERPFVPDPNDESLLEGNTVDDSVVSGSNFTDPDGGFGEKSVLGNGFGVSRTSVPDNGVSDEKPAGSRPSLVIVPPESTLMEPTDEEGEFESSSEPEAVDIGVVSVPIAVVSWDSDDDFEEADDDEPIGAVRARVNVVEVEDEDGEQEFESSVEDNVNAVKGTADDGFNKLMEEKGFDNSETVSYLASEDDVILGNSEINNDVEEVLRLGNMDQGESELVDHPLSEEINDTHLVEFESKHGTDDAEEAKFDSAKGSEDGGFIENVEMNEDFEYSVREIEKLEFMEQQESEAKDGPSHYIAEETNLKETKLTLDGEEDGGSINDDTLESKLPEEGGFPSVAKEAATKDVEFDVAEVAEVPDELEDKAGDSLPPHSGRFSFSDEDSKSSIFGHSDSPKVVMNHLEQSSSPSSLGESSEKLLQTTQRQVLGDSDDEVDMDEEAEVKELFGSDVLTALLKAASAAGSSRGNSSDFASHFASFGLTDRGVSEENLREEEKKRLKKLQEIRVKFLRLIHRLGLSPEDSVAAQVLYRLVLAAGRSTTQIFDLESAKVTALQLEAEKKDDLDFSLNILVLGKTGVGKSATINSIFGEKRAGIDAFEPATASVKVIAGDIDGVKVRILDTPGLRSSQMEQAFNRKVLSSIKKFTRKCLPDIVLYVDRLDTQARDLGDVPLLKSITSFLGSSIWSNAIITLTHASSTPPDGPSGSPLSHDLFVAQRSRLIQEVITQLLNPRATSPVSLVENHPEKREDGDTRRTELLLLCYSMKILSEANSLERTDLFDRKKLFGFRSRSVPLLYFLSSLLQPNTHPKLPNQGGDTFDSDNEMGDFSDSDLEDNEYDYDQLPPFKPLKRSEIENLSKEQKKAYFEEYDYRVRLLQKKQIKEEQKNLRELKKRDSDGYMEEESGNPETVAVPLPDMSLPLSFDGENPSHRYRFLELTSQLVSRPVLDLQGWDHDFGYDGVSLETNLAIAGSFPAVAAVQVTKDKKDFNIHLDSSVSAKHGENGSRSTMAGFGVLPVGQQLAYVLKGETKVKTHKSNRTACGVSVTFLGKNVATGVKIDDRICLGKRMVLSGSTGLVRSEGDTAYGANFEVRVREKEFPIGEDETTLGVSLMRWRGDLIWGGNLQSQVSVGRSCKMVVRAGLNNKRSGQVSVRTSSSDQLQIALLGMIPIANALFKNFFTGTSKM